MSTKTLEWARRYRALGMNPVPLRTRTKKPPLISWKKYQNTAPTDADLERWFLTPEPRNIALVLGRGLFAVDLDGPGAESALRDAGVELPQFAPRQRTINGFHVLLEAPGPIPDRVAMLASPDINPETQKPVWQVDIRGVGYIVVQPSVHPDGPAYEWIIQPTTMEDIPTAPQALLDMIYTPTSGPTLPATASAGGGGPSDTPGWLTTALAGAPEGSRDHTCARLAGLTTVPARVLDLDDQQALEYQAAENIHRKDLTPIEEARAFQTLIAAGKYTVAQLAQVVDKSEAYVYRSTNLLGLPIQVIALIESGDLTPAHGHQLLRVPEEKREETFMAWFDEWECRTEGKNTAKHLQEFIEQTLGQNLDASPFPKKDAYAGLPGCTACPDNSGNHGMLFDGAEKGKCLNRTCFNQKIDHFWNERTLALTENHPGVQITISGNAVYQNMYIPAGSRVSVELTKNRKLATDESLVISKPDNKVWVSKAEKKSTGSSTGPKPKTPREKFIASAVTDGISEAADKLKHDMNEKQIINLFRTVDSWELTNLCKDLKINRKKLEAEDCLKLGALVVSWHNCNDDQLLDAVGIDVKKLTAEITKKAGAEFDAKTKAK